MIMLLAWGGGGWAVGMGLFSALQVGTVDGNLNRSTARVASEQFPRLTVQVPPGVSRGRGRGSDRIVMLR